MTRELIEGFVTVCTAIIGVALVATLVSKNANTATVLTAGGQALGAGLTAAEGPVLSTSANSLLSAGWTGGAPTDMASY